MSSSIEPALVEPVEVLRVGAGPRSVDRFERAPLRYSERVTVSDAGREASRELDRPVLGQVRWYRAPKAMVRATISDAYAAAPRGSEGAASPTPSARPHLAVQAYLKIMASKSETVQAEAA